VAPERSPAQSGSGSNATGGRERHPVGIALRDTLQGLQAGLRACERGRPRTNRLPAPRAVAVWFALTRLPLRGQRRTGSVRNAPASRFIPGEWTPAGHLQQSAATVRPGGGDSQARRVAGTGSVSGVLLPCWLSVARSVPGGESQAERCLRELLQVRYELSPAPTPGRAGSRCATTDAHTGVPGDLRRVFRVNPEHAYHRRTITGTCRNIVRRG
jgi:hypothetical protein